MVLPSIESLKTSKIEGLPPASRFSAWAAAATNSAYSALAFGIYIFLYKLWLYSIIFLAFGL